MDRRLGQHFLVDASVVADIVAALNMEPDAQVLEIGCGAGTLTQQLAAVASRVVAVDLDPGCVRAAGAALRGAANISVLHADARDVDPATLGFPQRWWLAGNLPYHLTGVLVSRFFELPAPPVAAVFLVQREVAARLSAGPGDWSLATVAVRTIADVERLRDVPPQAFLPPPAVDSSLIRMRSQRRFDDATRAAMIALARAVFQQRRKTLRHGMAHALGGDAAAAAEAIRRSGVDSGRRPGTLALDEWETLARAAATVREAPR